MKIQCSRYHQLDEKIIELASSLGLPLIGGTAMEIWANETKTPGVRKRSDNDLDFITSSEFLYKKFMSQLKALNDENKAKVDVMLVKSHDFTPWIRDVNGVKVMAPEYLMYSKATRGESKDAGDIQWLSSIKSLTDEQIENVCNNCPMTEEDVEFLLNSISNGKI